MKSSKTIQENNSEAFSLNHLDDVSFEEFCYDLLSEMGFSNLSWRKGTGLSSSPSDNGRDIDCEYIVTEIDGEIKVEKWFVECKHYVKGVPAGKLESALAWASASDVNVVLFAISNFLSNSAKNYLEKYEDSNSPKFRIKVWEKPEFEKLTLGKSRLKRKYNISGEFPILEILHPAHILLLKEITFNTIDYFFELCDQLEEDDRDNILSWAYQRIIRPRYKSITPEILDSGLKMKDLRIDEVSFNAFKRKCYEILQSELISENILVSIITDTTLSGLIGISDINNIDKVKSNQLGFLDSLRMKVEESTDKEEVKRLNSVIKKSMEMFNDTESRINNNYEMYKTFCDKVLSFLLLENI